MILNVNFIPGGWGRNIIIFSHADAQNKLPRYAAGLISLFMLTPMLSAHPLRQEVKVSISYIIVRGLESAYAKYPSPPED